MNMGEDDSCSCRTPDLNEKYPEAECQGCGKPKRLSDDDLADPRSSTTWRPITTPRWALNLSWPKPESSELQQFTSHIQINGDNDVADRVANFLRAKETTHDSSQISSGVDDNAAPSVDVGKLSLPSKDGLEALPKGDYAYDRLGSSKSKNLLDHWFRLLRISPYSKGGPVHGFLERYTLREAPRFEALSYTWSEEFEKPEDEDRRCGRPLFIGKHFQRLAVTRNCENALQRLRNLGKEYVWIDAVCINQSDLNDKKQQIALMHQIYSRAAKVLIYLGPQQEPRAVHALAQDESELKESLSRGNYIQGLRSFFSKPYFSRIWVIQEVVLAKVGIVICGDETVQWHDVNAKSNSQEFTSLISVPAWIRHSSAPRSARKIMRPYELGDWIFKGMSSDASDAKDKIFAFFGLAEDTLGWGLVADYDLSVEQVYTGISAYLIEEGRIWDILDRAHCDVAIKGDKPLDLPSWVPDFRREAPKPLERWHAEIDSRYKPQFSTLSVEPTQVLRQTGSLVVHGHRLLSLPYVRTQEDKLLLERPEFGIRFLFETPFLQKTDFFFLPRLQNRLETSPPRPPTHGGAENLQQSDAPTYLLHIRATDLPYAFRLVGRCVFQIELSHSPTLKIPSNSIADDMVPLREADFKHLWAVYRVLWSIRNHVEVLRSSWGSSQNILTDSETAWQQYEKLCATPPKLPQHDNERMSRRDIQGRELADVLAFRKFWEDEARVEIWSNRVIIGRLAEWVRQYDTILPRDRRSRYLELFDTWKASRIEARDATERFLETFRDSTRLDVTLAVQRINSWKNITLKLLEMINYGRWNDSWSTSLPNVDFSGYLYSDKLIAERTHQLVEAPEYPSTDGFIMYLHHINSSLGLPERVGKLPDVGHVEEIFDGILRTLKEGDKNLIRFCTRKDISDSELARALIGDWTNVGDWLWVLTVLDRLSDAERSAFPEVIRLEKELEVRAKWRQEVKLGWGKQETVILV